MPVYRCFAWSYAVGPPEVNITVVLPKLIFAETRPLAIIKFVDNEVIPQNNDSINGPLPLDEIEIGVDVIPEVPNWRP
jgi:hypothetical protein